MDEINTVAEPVVEAPVEVAEVAPEAEEVI